MAIGTGTRFMSQDFKSQSVTNEALIMTSTEAAIAPSISPWYTPFTKRALSERSKIYNATAIKAFTPL